MAATANPNKTVMEWCKVFHAQGTENYTSSITFMKQLSVIAISTITYLKNLVPDDCYTVENFAGHRLRILKAQCEDEMAQFLSSALTHAFDALEKKYLHKLALCFYEDECKLENLMEYHIFEYQYTAGGVSMNVHSKTQNNQKQSVKCTFEDIKTQTMFLIRACIVMLESSQRALPPRADISLRLYYNDDAPEGYQAPGYRCDESSDHLEPTAARAIKLGCVQTPFHKLVARTYTRDEMDIDAVPTPNPPMTTITQRDFSGELAGSLQKSVSGASELQLNCPCNKYEDIGAYQAPLLITCQHCNTLQHAACFGLLPPQVARLSHHACVRCGRERRPTDPRLAALRPRQRECLCIFRRTLAWCLEEHTMDGARLVDRFRLSNVNAAKLMRLLNEYEIVQFDGDSDLVTPRKINHEMLQIQINKYFQTDDSNVGDQLLAETLASQESQPDPVGDALSPVERTSLENSTNLYRVIDTAKVEIIPMDAEDPMLQQYRQAILSEVADGNEKRGGKRKMNAVDDDLVEERQLRSGGRSRAATVVKRRKVKD